MKAVEKAAKAAKAAAVEASSSSSAAAMGNAVVVTVVAVAFKRGGVASSGNIRDCGRSRSGGCRQRRNWR